MRVGSLFTHEMGSVFEGPHDRRRILYDHDTPANRWPWILELHGRADIRLGTRQGMRNRAGQPRWKDIHGSPL